MAHAIAATRFGTRSGRCRTLSTTARTTEPTKALNVTTKRRNGHAGEVGPNLPAENASISHASPAENSTDVIIHFMSGYAIAHHRSHPLGNRGACLGIEPPLPVPAFISTFMAKRVALTGRRPMPSDGCQRCRALSTHLSGGEGAQKSPAGTAARIGWSVVIHCPNPFAAEVSRTALFMVRCDGSMAQAVGIDGPVFNAPLLQSCLTPC